MSDLGASSSPVLTRNALIDIALSSVSVTIGVVGFHTSFAGNEAMVVGVPAVVLGTVVGVGIVRRRLPLLVGALVAIVAFFVLGPVAGVRANAIASVIPTPKSALDLVDGTVNGWIRLLTTVPPAGQAGNLLAIPYLTGFAGACATVVSALVVRRNSFCIVPPAIVMAVSVLFGVERPAALLLQGALFGALLVGWVVLRNRRRQMVTVAAVRSRRAVEGVAMLSVAAIGALVIGPALPFVDTDDRYVLREVVEPPFDPSQYPSPLIRFRDFHGQQPIPQALFTVRGLPAGEVVRYAVMDDYDGYVWKASPPRTAGGGSYERVGSRIPTDVRGEEVEVTFTMGALGEADAVWIPTVGVTQAVAFDGPRNALLTDELRYNRAASAAAAPIALREGDVWTVDAVLAEPPDPEELRTLQVAPLAAAASEYPLTDKMKERLAEWTRDTTSPFATVEAIIGRLTDIGAYNDGLPETPIAPGHSLYRLAKFLEDDQPQGNGEQYAAGVAYLARSLGIPARVVLEFAPTASTGGEPVQVMAKDARAMVEIALDGAGWVRVPNPTPDESKKPQPQVAKIEKQAINEVQPPPPAPPKPPAELPDNPPPARKQIVEEEPRPALTRLLLAVLKVLGVVALVAAVVVGPALAVVFMKARRRRRRRTTGTAAARVLGAWQELTDVARDHGQLVPPKATRREVGVVVPAIGSSQFPDHVDALLFGPGEPGEAEVDEVWSRLAEIERQLLGGKSRAERVRGAISLTSLR